MKADLGSHIDSEYLVETCSRQPGLYRIIVLHENNNLG